ncbi:MAG TPA: hypothetical protein VGZ03_08690 [Acidimicrobiales bacterium]|nr:hypothetical protein [Acidimicrobiales bacterium]
MVVTKEPATTTAHTAAATLTRGWCIVTLRRRSEVVATSEVLLIRWPLLNMRNNLTVERHAIVDAITTAPQFMRR